MQLSIVEIPYETGSIRFRYSRYLSEAGDRWIRHGHFLPITKTEHWPLREATFTAPGTVNGRIFHSNGQLAAKGVYENGDKAGERHYWQADGRLEV